MSVYKEGEIAIGKVIDNLMTDTTKDYVIVYMHSDDSCKGIISTNGDGMKVIDIIDATISKLQLLRNSTLVKYKLSMFFATIHKEGSEELKKALEDKTPDYYLKLISSMIDLPDNTHTNKAEFSKNSTEETIKKLFDTMI